MSFGISVEIVENNNTIRRLIANALAKDVNGVLVKKRPNLEAAIKLLLNDRIRNSFEYQSLTAARGTGGGLRAEFGLSAPIAKLLTIIDKWLDSVNVVLDPVRAVSGGLRGGITLVAVKSDFQDVLSLEEATQLSDGGDIPWLEWFLTKAGQGVVADYRILVRTFIKASRSGNAIMVERPGRVYEVPDKPFAGTITDNWITRIIDDMRPDIEVLLTRMLE